MGSSRSVCTTRECAWLGRDHHRRHLAICRKPGHECAHATAAMTSLHPVEDQLDRQRLAAPGRNCAVVEPIEACGRIVAILLQRPTSKDPQRLPFGFVVLATCRLRAAIHGQEQGMVSPKSSGSGGYVYGGGGGYTYALFLGLTRSCSRRTIGYLFWFRWRNNE